jgi:type II secretory pathway component PulM
MSDYQELSKMSITELKQLLSCVNQDIKSIKRAEKIAADNQPSEYDIANSIAKRFTNKQYPAPIENRRIKEDIQIQRDILDYLNNGGHIITRVSRKKIKPLTVLSYHKVSL